MELQSSWTEDLPPSCLLLSCMTETSSWLQESVHRTALSVLHTQAARTPQRREGTGLRMTTKAAGS